MLISKFDKNCIYIEKNVNFNVVFLILWIVTTLLLFLHTFSRQDLGLIKHYDFYTNVTNDAFSNILVITGNRQ